MTKLEYAKAIGAILQLSDNEVKSLEKAGKSVLVKLWQFMREQSKQVGPRNS